MSLLVYIVLYCNTCVFVSISFTRISVEFMFTEIFCNNGVFVILIVGFVVYIVASCCLLFEKTVSL